MNIQNVFELMDRFEGASMTELILEMEGSRLVLKKGADAKVTAASAAPIQKMVEQGEEETALKEETLIEAPLVGTFYSAPSPEEKNFVDVGQEVKKGDVVGIIEAMKLMNEITAPCDGVISSVQVENGQMVEYHQVLMRMK